MVSFIGGCIMFYVVLRGLIAICGDLRRWKRNTKEPKRFY